ncbi:extracellular solute-binding protein [Cohnella endophytica]|uniref:Extracellular solute-binding protein n=1 Tax=Cohnella endophytica TaxID=2419778 RepID=A0A494XLK3_9BACL|nr:extracellular solute-binding protein [Cohnella endophytica]RKP48934.1 extracellular solute-binding protein [Cohnella endophytica]
MFKIMAKTTLGSVLVLSLLLSACSKNNNGAPAASGSQATSSESQPAASESASASSPAIDPLGKYDPPIEITTFRSTNETLEANLPAGETLDKNRWLDAFEQDLGIKVKYDWVAKAGDQYDQKINLSLSSGALPDIIPVNVNQLKQLAESDQIEDLTAAFEQYASPLTKELLMQEGDRPFNAAKFNGKLMGIPSIASSRETQNFVWIREDWLKNLGLTPPKTMQDLLKIAEAFTKNDPDQNGKNDTQGLALIKDLTNVGYAVLEGFFNGYHAYPGIFVKDANGKLVYGSTQKEMIAPLTQLHQMYVDGIIDKEFITKDAGKVGEDTVAGKNGMFFGAHWNFAWPIQLVHDANVKADYQAYPIVSIDDKMAMTEVNLATNTYYAVKKGSKNPEAIVKLINMFLEKNYGATNDFNKYYRDTEGHELWSLSPFSALPPNKNIENNIAILDAIKNNDNSKLNPESMSVWDNVMKYKNDKDEANHGWFKAFSENGVGDLMVQYANDNRHIFNEFYGAPGDNMKKYSATLLKFEKEMITKFIVGKEPLSNFDKYVADYNKLGGEAIEKEVNEWSQSLQK